MKHGEERTKAARKSNRTSPSAKVQSTPTAPPVTLADAYTRTQELTPPISEFEAWEQSRGVTGVVTPSPSATDAVLRRAVAVDVVAARQPEAWPVGLERSPVLDVGTLLDAKVIRRCVRSSAAPGPQSLEVVVERAASVYYREYCIRLLGERLDEHRLLTWLNLYPRSDSIPALILAPLVRRTILTPTDPAWYFRSITQIATLRRERPWFVPFGATAGAIGSVPVEYGWKALSVWQLRAHLLTSQNTIDDERLRHLVDYAVDRLRALNSSVLANGRLAPRFADACSPLRDYLYWHATEGRHDEETRLRHRDWLARLVQAIAPRMPPQVPVNLEDAIDLYERVLPTVRRIWSKTRGTRSVTLRRDRLERGFEWLDMLGGIEQNERYSAEQAKPLARVRDRFWRECGDLNAIAAAEFSARFAIFLSSLLEFVGQRGPITSPAAVSNGAAALSRRWKTAFVEYQRFKERLAIDRDPRYFAVDELLYRGEWIEDPVFFR